MAQSKNPFPKDFFWGASTASHQVEGGTINQWSRWELENASELAKTFEARWGWLPIWKAVKKQGTDPNNYVSGAGVDHYKRYEEDFNLAKQLHLNAFRFGIEWSRIEPEEGQWNEEAIEHYRTYIKELRARGLEPFLNLWHWTNPTWFEDKGGWTKRANLKYFERFVAKVAEELCDDVTYVLTVNEVNSYVTFGFFTPKWPPAKRMIVKGLAAYYNLMLAHKRAYRILKKAQPALQVGSAHQATANLPLNPKNPFDRLMAAAANYGWHGWFYRRIRKQQDFLGFNFYFVCYYSGFRMVNPPKPVNDLGWYMEPAQIAPLMRKLYKKFKRPLIITENGVADYKDQYRQWWMEETIKAMMEVLEEGIPLKGYLHWSLLDNFEWEMGWWPKFGLIEVDRENDMARKIRPSAQWLARKIKVLRES